MFQFLLVAVVFVAALLYWLVFQLGRASRDVWPKPSAIEREPGQAGASTSPDDTGHPAEKAHRPIKILFLGSAPMDAIRLALGREVHEIESKLRESEQGRRIVFAQEWGVGPTELQAVFQRHKPQIVHFSGHGDASGQLLFEDERGTACPVSVDALGGLFSTLGDGISCVVLNACYSEAQADAIRAHVPCVVGMRTVVPDRAAIAFSSSFYLALGYGHSVQIGFDRGRAQIKLAGLSDTDAPVLLCRPDTDANNVKFALTETKPRR